jgi:hypothetical protein
MEGEGAELKARWTGKVVAAEPGIANGRHQNIQDPGHVVGLVVYPTRFMVLASMEAWAA